MLILFISIKNSVKVPSSLLISNNSFRLKMHTFFFCRAAFSFLRSYGQFVLALDKNHSGPMPWVQFHPSWWARFCPPWCAGWCSARSSPDSKSALAMEVFKMLTTDGATWISKWMDKWRNERRIILGSVSTWTLELTDMDG